MELVELCLYFSDIIVTLHIVKSAVRKRSHEANMIYGESQISIHVFISTFFKKLFHSKLSIEKTGV